MRYKRIMDKIEVTDEMQSRILRNIQNAELKAPSSKLLFMRFKNYMIAASIGILLLFAAAVPGLVNRTGPTEPMPLAAPDIKNFSSVQELSKALGFSVTELAKLPFEVTGKTYTAFGEKAARIQYSGDGQSATYLESYGSDDNSGDYNTYDTVTEHKIGSYAVTLKGDGSSCSLALWTNGKFSYSLKLSNALPEDDVLEIISQTMGEK